MTGGDDTRGGGLDWAAAYRRLARLAAASEAATTADPEREAALLDERARALARPLEQQARTGPLLELVHFRSGEQDYALEARFVLEVLRAPEQLVPLPGAPQTLRGLTLLHGEVLAVVELAPLFGRDAPTTHGPVLVVGMGRPELGLRTDMVEELLLVSRDTLLPPPGALDARERTLVSGISRDGIIVLEGEALLEDGRLFFDFSEERTA
ncbi:chemotaxis protein CheW [Vitiosangium sp. GDMCC 1.1324]|uniref:chemotaxis protein CheW n=1 Tax=Vitiosangium sp. (strain GDMCC 1.1324) TaxID=2138576 RepID=UPI000D34BFE4|nr:chemotaxis protein CheW [Vitiosangium sp. GDMCC 1.1324]PTL83191.1 chemotaxis protein CheW [Vitiosangium sp. GDMCC 1.1324]